MSDSINKPIRRRTFLKAGVVAGLGGLTYGVTRMVGGPQPHVDITRVGAYADDLVAAIAGSFQRLGITDLFAGKRVLLKPNLVETAPVDAPINTHPAVVAAAAEVIRRFDAREVFVAEGAGHRRDTDLVLDQSGLGNMMDGAGLRFVDLNIQPVIATPNRSRNTTLEDLFLPEPLVRADLVVSMAKMKTHHWAGATLSMKNLFGVMPGIVYGWPKNRLHFEGIHQSIVDINATVAPQLAIVDGIVGMDGDGPIMGNAKPAGVLVIGRNLPSVDATCCRIMKLDPMKVGYLDLASSRNLGAISRRAINVSGASIDDVVQDFRVLDHFAHIKT